MAVGTVVHHLVVGVDGSEPALRAVDWAVDEAVRHGLPLRIVYGSLWERFEQDALADTPGVAPEAVTEHALAQAVVAAACDRAKGRGPTLEIGTEVVPGDAVSALLGEAHDAFAVVTGGRGRGPIKELLLGSVSLTLSARAPCPIVVVRGREENREAANGRVVLGVGDPATSAAAVRFAVAEAAARGCELEAVRVWRQPLHRPEPHLLLKGEPAHHQEEASTLLEDAVTAALEDRGDAPAVPVAHRVVEGSVRQVLLARSAEADLLVLGGHRRHGHFGLQIGRVAHAVLHHADCPVAVIPQRA